MCLQELTEALKICNYIFTLIFVLESVFKLVAFGFRRFFKDKLVVKLKKKPFMKTTWTKKMQDLCYATPDA